MFESKGYWIFFLFKKKAVQLVFGMSVMPTCNVGYNAQIKSTMKAAKSTYNFDGVGMTWPPNEIKSLEFYLISVQFDWKYSNLHVKENRIGFKKSNEMEDSWNGQWK